MKNGWPANKSIAITKSDTVNLPPYVGSGLSTSGVWVGTGGNLVAVFPDGSTGTLLNVADGTLLDLAVIRINDTSTTASDLVALYQV